MEYPRSEGLSHASPTLGWSPGKQVHLPLGGRNNCGLAKGRVVWAKDREVDRARPR